MRILLLNYEFPPIGGGAATASAQVARHMANRGIEISILTSHLPGLPSQERRDGYTIYRVPVLRRRPDRCSVLEMGAFILGAALPAVRLARAFRPDLMHVYFGMPTGPVGLLVHRLVGVPYLLSLRGGDVPGFMGKELARLHRRTMPLTRVIWHHAARIVVNSEGLHKLAGRISPYREIDVVPNGVDGELFHPGEAGGVRNGKVHFLFVGRLAGQKGVPYLLRGLATLDSELLDKIDLEIVGDGPEMERLVSIATECGLKEQVSFSGWVPRTEIVEHYRSADVFVMPSLDEGMPNAVLEAMACGLPILATDIRGNRELVKVGINGMLVPPGDSEALGQALTALSRDGGLRRRMGEAGAALSSRYSWSRVADQYLAISSEIIKTGDSERVEGRRQRAYAIHRTLPTSLVGASNGKVPLIGRSIFSGFLLILVLLNVDVTSLVSVAQRSDLFFLLLAAAASFAGWLINSFKWQLILREYAIARRFSELLYLNFIGMFYNLFLPGQIAGEVVKSVKLTRSGLSAFSTAASVAADRITGLLAIFLLGMSGILASPNCFNERSEFISWLAIFIFILASLTIVLLYGPRFGFLSGSSGKSLALFATVVARLKPPVTIGKSAYADWNRAGRAAGPYIRLWGILLLSVIFQIIVVYVNWLLCGAFGITVSFVDLLWIVAIVAVVQSLPLSIAGLGVREGTYVALLVQLGVDGSDALAVSLSVLAIQLLMATAGGLLLILVPQKEVRGS